MHNLRTFQILQNYINLWTTTHRYFIYCIIYLWTRGHNSRTFQILQYLSINYSAQLRTISNTAIITNEPQCTTQEISKITMFTNESQRTTQGHFKYCNIYLLTLVHKSGPFEILCTAIFTYEPQWPFQILQYLPMNHSAQPRSISITAIFTDEPQCTSQGHLKYCNIYRWTTVHKSRQFKILQYLLRTTQDHFKYCNIYLWAIVHNSWVFQILQYLPMNHSAQLMGISNTAIFTYEPQCTTHGYFKYCNIYLWATVHSSGPFQILQYLPTELQCTT